MTNLQSFPQDSSLAETNPATLDELFNRDPLGLAEADLERIVTYFREKRDQWMLEEAAPKVAGPKAPKAKLTLDALKGIKI